jgi:hypothetical protein
MIVVRTVILKSLLAKYKLNDEVYLFVSENDGRSDEEIIQAIENLALRKQNS